MPRISWTPWGRRRGEIKTYPIGYIYTLSPVGYNLQIYLKGDRNMDKFIATPHQLAILLRDKRKKKGETQKETAEKIGLLPKTISLLENSPEKSSLESLMKLLSALDLELHIADKEPLGDLSAGDEW